MGLNTFLIYSVVHLGQRRSEKTSDLRQTAPLQVFTSASVSKDLNLRQPKLRKGMWGIGFRSLLTAATVSTLYGVSEGIQFDASCNSMHHEPMHILVSVKTHSQIGRQYPMA